MDRTSLSVMAWRNLWRNRRRTLLTLASITFGVFLAIVAMSAQDQNWADMINMGARMGGGHVTLQHPEYLETPSLSRTVQRTDRLRALAESDGSVTAAMDRITGQMMISTARESFGSGFLAFDPDVESELTLSFVDALSAGVWFAADDRTGIVLGAGLAQNLGADLGDKVVYTATDRHGQIVSGLGRVRGLIATGSPSLDAGMVLLPLAAARRSLGYAPEEATQIAVFVNDHRNTDAVASRLAGDLEGDVVAVPWRDGRPELAAFIAMKVGGAVIMIAVIALMVCAGIFNTVFVSVMERLREFGILLAVGFSPGKLFRLVIYESVWLGLVGLAAAGAVTVGPYLYLNRVGIDMSAILGDAGTEVSGIGMSPILKFGIYPENLTKILVLAFAAVVVAGIYPAWRAGRVEPVESIRLG